ncbi:hypothetical protein GCM10012319_45830 [Comamonas sp. KCTC 72670]|nr:hypothetical protein GCM10012319_45830 [Comamonas sp. KCTC 72670]
MPPGRSGSVPRLNQNFAVMAGSTNAAKTSAAGRRIIIEAFATGAAFGFDVEAISASLPARRDTRPGHATFIQLV